MANIDLSVTYALINGLLGSSTALASTWQNDSLIVEPVGSGDSQLWYFTETSLQSYYRLHTVGKGNFTSLDVYSYVGRPTIDLHFYATQDLTGQYWRFDKQGDGSFKISNNFTGPDMYLDVQEGKVMLAARDSKSQHWTLSSLGSTPTSTSTATMLSTSGSTITPAAHTGSKKLAVGAVAGIVVAAVLLMAGLFVGAYIIRRRRKKTKTTPPQPPRQITQNPVYHV